MRVRVPREVTSEVTQINRKQANRKVNPKRVLPRIQSETAETIAHKIEKLLLYLGQTTN